MKLLNIAVLAVFLTGFVCKSGDTVKGTSATPVQGADTTIIPPPPPETKPSPESVPAPVVQSPTALKPNATRVTGSIKSIEPIDTLNFRAVLHIDSAFAIGDMLSLIGAGADIKAAPRLIKDENGVIEKSNERNRRFLRLRSKSPGAPFSGKVSMQGPGVWVIIDADSL